MEDKLIELLESFAYPVRRQGSFADNEKYPKSFITFWNNSEVELSAYDNDTESIIFDFDVNVYSTDPKKVYDLLNDVRDLLKLNGFISPTRGYDVGSDEPTHKGRGVNVQYVQSVKGNSINVLDDISNRLKEIIELQNKYIGG